MTPYHLVPVEDKHCTGAERRGRRVQVSVSDPSGESYQNQTNHTCEDIKRKKQLKSSTTGHIFKDFVLFRLSLDRPGLTAWFLRNINLGVFLKVPDSLCCF